MQAALDQSTKSTRKGKNSDVAPRSWSLGGECEGESEGAKERKKFGRKADSRGRVGVDEWQSSG